MLASTCLKSTAAAEALVAGVVLHLRVSFVLSCILIEKTLFPVKLLDMEVSMSALARYGKGGLR